MTTDQSVAPNTLDGAATQHNAMPGLDQIAAKMTAMRENAQRNRPGGDQPVAAGSAEEANTATPVAPDGEEPSVEPEIADTEVEVSAAATDEDIAQDTVSESDTDTTSQEIIDFIEFAETNPNAKFKFMRNGKEVILDARKAAAILGQGGAIHEEARELKIKKSEFEEYERERRQQLDGLTLAMEFTIQPRLQQAYDEIVKTQGYQATFQQQLAQVRDPAHQARIRASMEQNERYIAQQSDTIRSLKPRIDQFYDHRREQVKTILDTNRKAFTDKELKNEYVYNELREKVTQGWKGAREQLVPGVDNIDLIASDEFILGLIRDGLKFRDRPVGKSAGASIAQLQNRKGAPAGQRSNDQNIQALREQAKGRGREATQAADNLLVSQLNRLRSARSR
jgi:hypothetical protein